MNYPNFVYIQIDTAIVKQDYGENMKYQIHSPTVKYRHRSGKNMFGMSLKLNTLTVSKATEYSPK